MYFAIAGICAPSYPSHLNRWQRLQEGGVSFVEKTQTFSSHEIFHCLDCHHTFDSFSAMETHRYSMHPYECPHCERRFNARSTLYRHCNAKHGQNKSLECHLCGKMFAHKQSKSKHMWNVHQLTMDSAKWKALSSGVIWECSYVSGVCHRVKPETAAGIIRQQ